MFSKGAEFFGQRIPELPSPLGQVLATFDLFERVPVADRVTMIGLLYATIDYVSSDEPTACAHGACIYARARAPTHVHPCTHAGAR